MTPQQVATIYDSLPEDQQDMPREQFIKRAMSAIDPAKNKRILDAMVERKHQQRIGEMQRARIDAALQAKRLG